MKRKPAPAIVQSNAGWIGSRTLRTWNCCRSEVSAMTSGADSALGFDEHATDGIGAGDARVGDAGIDEDDASGLGATLVGVAAARTRGPLAVQPDPMHSNRITTPGHACRAIQSIQREGWRFVPREGASPPALSLRGARGGR